MKQRMIRDIHCHIMEPHSLIAERDFQPPTEENAEEIEEIRKYCGLVSLAVPAITLYDREDFGCNLLALKAKQLSPGAVYALAGIRRYVDRDQNKNMLDQARLLMQSGFDGFKMICKPNARRKFSCAIDDPVFEEFYGEAEEKQWPILFHVGDPPSFWKKECVPPWAMENGWFYGEEGLPSYEELYEEVDHVLTKYPTLKITFAHFFFLSQDLKKAACYLDKYPNVCLDITPGSEMYVDFGKNRKEAAAFFELYKDRILFGTDNVAVNGSSRLRNREESRDKIDRIRLFLETEEAQSIAGEAVCGLGLTEETLDAIYDHNFMKFLGNKEPAPVNLNVYRQWEREYGQ